MKTVTNSAGKALVVLDDAFGFNELNLMIKSLRLADSEYTHQISQFKDAIKDLDKTPDDPELMYNLDTLNQALEIACNDRRYNFAMLRKLQQIERGFVDLEISPYILGTDLTTLRGWL